MSVRQILKARRILCIVPDARKAAAVQACLEGEVSPLAPASILQTHAATTVYLDQASAAQLEARYSRLRLRARRVMRITFPGLFDLQVNGFAGVDFNAPDLTADEVSLALARMRATGVTRVLPTLVTSPFEDFAASARVLASITDAAIAGIHMEGPYLSPEDGPRGAHPRAHVRPASATTSIAVRTPPAGASCS